MRRQFVRDGVIYGGATLLSGLTNVLLVSVHTRGLEQSAYGVVEYIAVLQALVQVVIGLEVTQAIARYYGGSESDDERRSYASTGLWYLVIAYGIACAVLFLASDRLEAALLEGVVPAGVLRPAIVSIYLGILFTAVRSQLRWEFRALRYVLVSLVALALTVGLSTYLLLVVNTGVVGVFVASGVGHAVGLALCLAGLRSTYRRAIDVAKLRTMLRFSVPLVFSTLALFVATYSDRLIVRGALGFDALGVYGAGARVAAVISLASAGFQLGAAPLIYRNYRRPETPGTLSQLLRLFVAAGSVVVIALAASSLELVAFFLAPAYADAWRIVPLLALATLLASGYIFVPGLTVNDRTSLFATINIVSAGVTLASIALLAQVFGIVGAALGAAVGAGVGFALHAGSSQRVYRLPMAWWRIGAAIGIAMSAIGIGAALGQPGIPFAAGRGLLFVAGASGVILLGLEADDRALIARAASAFLRRGRPEAAA